MTIKEFQIPYLFMLRQENEDKNNDYNYTVRSINRSTWSLTFRVG